MECDCDMSAEAFDGTKQPPKVLPCGHTACLQCLRRLPGRSCPTCRRDFNGPLEGLPTNFSLLKLMEGMKLDSTPCAWCSDCRAAARPRCWEQAHDVLPVRRALKHHLQGALQQATEQLQGLQDRCQDVQALAALILLTGESWDVSLRGGDRELMGTLCNTEEPLSKALWLLLAARAGLTEDRAAARNPPPAAAPTTAAPTTAAPPAAAPPADAPTAAAPPAAASLAAAPPIAAPPAAPDSPPAAVPPAAAPPAVAPPAGATPAARLTRVSPPAVVRPTRVMNVRNISQSGPDDTQKVAALRFVENVTRLSHVYCDKDPAWSLHLLWRAAPTVLDLGVMYPREAHLLAVHAMPRLRRLYVFSGDALDAQPPVLPALPPGRRGLQLLKVLGLPRATTLSLLQAHGESLEDLQLEVGTGTDTDSVWRESCGSLHSQLEQCGLRVLRRLVLVRSGLHAHSALACVGQRAQVRGVLPGVEVLCSRCSYAKAGQKVFNFGGMSKSTASTCCEDDADSEERILKNLMNYHLNGPKSVNLNNLRRLGRQIAFLNMRELQPTAQPSS
ncbi:uncharacterized protein LOC113217539 [Frankliniella occidentalis]|uniref:Uncharacterized protein LOC113217539 n=1 Tax=Frankliniella occidentalis TaxID=133901 RepID=A0A9C6XE50_FRAOC|nr:uncharacterized protein LOC113217539 [Frankliniella occidentalis]XP_052133599.1 uncharacterized protein LOC113217539 [Frankliniella occidentalis]XP_052133600.1 uncharacterized protein LOC113217539 [Frankliniella occidentalis]